VCVQYIKVGLWERKIFNSNGKERMKRVTYIRESMEIRLYIGYMMKKEENEKEMIMERL